MRALKTEKGSPELSEIPGKVERNATQSKDLLDALPIGLMLFSQDKLVFWNEVIDQLDEDGQAPLARGDTLVESLNRLSQLMEDAFEDPVAWVEQTLEALKAPPHQTEQQITDSRWFLIKWIKDHTSTEALTWIETTQNRYNEEVLLLKTQELEHYRNVILEQSHEIRRRNQQMQEDLDLAQDFQESILAKIQPPPFLDLAYTFRPFAEVSGDFFDWNIDSSGSFNLFLGDGTGHGVSAAFITMMAYVGLGSIPPETLPAEILSQLNALLSSKDLNGKYMSAVHLKIQPDGLLVTSNAGHPPLVVLPKAGSPVSMQKGGLPLAMIQTIGTKLEALYDNNQYMLEPGDRILLYTDGITEWPNPEGEQFGFQRLVDFFNQQEKDVHQLILKLLADLSSFSDGNPCDDDNTLILIEYKGR